jgi:hypothetical protein
MSQFGKRFVHDEDLAWETVGEGLRRKVMSYDDNVMMVKVAFEKGAVGRCIATIIHKLAM